MHAKVLPALALSLIAASSVAQMPRYVATAALRPGEPLQTLLVGTPYQPFVALVDVSGGPVPLLGQTLYLGLTPALGILDAGMLPPDGQRFRSLPTPASAPLWQPLYLQALVLDAAAPGGFRASDGESTVFHQVQAVLAEKFHDPIAQGFTGSYETGVRGRLQGGPVERRTQVVYPLASAAAAFGAPVRGALNPDGARAQMVYRAVDLGARGIPEHVTAIRWRPFGGQVFAETYQRLAIDVVHSDVVPNFSIGVFSALPEFPESGLSREFSENPRAGETPTRVYDGSYAITAAALRPDGYLPYPDLHQPFRYNGIDSLLLDFKMAPSPGTPGLNGAAVYLTVQSSAQPNARAVDAGTPANPVDPFASTFASTADNTWHDIQVDFARLETVAVSPWRALPALGAVGAPSVAASLPPGTAVRIELRGSNAPTGLSPTPWTAPTGLPLVGYRYVQYRLTFVADEATGAVPSVDAVVIPVL